MEQILIVKDGDNYKEMEEEHYARLSEAVWIGFYDGGYGNLKKINTDGKLFIEITDDFHLLSIKKACDDTTLWNFSLEGMQEDVRKRRDDIQEDEIMVGICQFEGNEDTGWLAVQAGPSSFFRIAYPSGNVTYIGEYMYSLCFSPDGKYAAYSDVDYDNRVGMDSEERANTPPQGIYILEMETGKTAYIYWPYEDPAQDFMEYRNFMWIEKEAFEEYMQEKVSDNETGYLSRQTYLRTQEKIETSTDGHSFAGAERI